MLKTWAHSPEKHMTESKIISGQLLLSFLKRLSKHLLQELSSQRLKSTAVRQRSPVLLCKTHFSTTVWKSFEVSRNWSDRSLQHGQGSCSPLFLCPRNMHSGFQLQATAWSSLTGGNSSPSLPRRGNTGPTAAVPGVYFALKVHLCPEEQLCSCSRTRLTRRQACSVYN